MNPLLRFVPGLRWWLSAWLLLLTGGALRAQQHQVWVRADGTLLAWGSNLGGQLGDGTQVSQRVPTVIGTARDWRTAVACGASTVALKTDGSLWIWGDNSYGQLGDGTTTGRLVPARLGTNTWRSIEGGDRHALAVRTDGTLWAWGDNAFGQLGTGTTISVPAPVQIGTDTNWQSVTAGSYFSLGIKTDGTLWAWGNNYGGQLGDGTTTGRLSPVQIGTATNWQSASAGSSHAVALRQDGTAWVWGLNSAYQLGQGPASPQRILAPVVFGGSSSRWISVSAGASQTMGVRQDGTLWGSGSNSYGELGDSTFVSRTSVTQVGTRRDWYRVVAGFLFTTAARQDGTLWGWGSNAEGQVGSTLLCTAIEMLPFQLTQSQTWRSVTAGRGHTLAIRSDGTLWAWGSNDDGQLGDSTRTYRWQPVQIGRAADWLSVAANQQFSMGIKTDGTLWAWGLNNVGQLGDGTTVDRNAPVQVGTDSWRAVALGLAHALAVRQDGTLWAWGENYAGQLGDGTITPHSAPAQVGTLTTWQSVTAGFNTSYALRTDGTLWGWGDNGYGQIGDGTYTRRRTPVQVGPAATWLRVGAGASHALAIRTDGTLWSWGSQDSGQLGNGARAGGRNSPGQVGSSTTWSAVDANVYHSLGLQQDGTVWAWGSNEYAQLGNGSAGATPGTLPAQVGTAPGGGTAQYANIDCGQYYSLGLRTDGTLWVWGSNFRGGLTYATPVPLLIGSNAVVLAAQGASRRPADFVAYPTVAAEVVRFSYAGPALPDDATLEVLSLSGRRVAGAVGSQVARSGQVAVAGLAPGWYLLRLNTGQRSYVARFFRP